VSSVYAERNMEPEKLPPAFDLPPFRAEFKGLNGVIAIVGGLGGIAGRFVPLPEKLEAFPRLRLWVVILLLLLAAVSVLYPWMKELSGAVYGRLRVAEKTSSVGGNSYYFGVTQMQASTC
jgi:hypothetical protein